MNPVLSLIIPVYNAEHYLKATLDSIITQPGFDKCEVIAVNDGSTDGSLQILLKYKARFSNIIVIDKPNEGVSATRNRALKIIRGDYVVCVDADDILHPQFFEVLLKEIRVSNADIIAWRYSAFYRNPKFERFVEYRTADYKSQDHDVFDYLETRGSATSLWLKALSQRLLKDLEIDTRLTFGEDMFFSWKCCLRADTVRYIEMPLYFYRQTYGNATSRFHADLYERYSDAFDDIENFARKNDICTEAFLLNLAYHFARRLPSLTAMEAKAPYPRSQKEKHLKSILADRRIRQALTTEKRLVGRIYELARRGDISAMLRQAYTRQIISRLSFPIKRLLK